MKPKPEMLQDLQPAIYYYDADPKEAEGAAETMCMEALNTYQWVSEIVDRLLASPDSLTNF